MDKLEVWKAAHIIHIKDPFKLRDTIVLLRNHGSAV